MKAARDLRHWIQLVKYSRRAALGTYVDDPGAQNNFGEMIKREQPDQSYEQNLGDLPPFGKRCRRVLPKLSFAPAKFAVAAQNDLGMT